MFIAMLLTILLVSLAITLALGFYVIITAPNEAINRTFASFIGMMILWILKDIAFWCFHKDNENSVWWGMVSFLIGTSLQIPLLLFAEVFPENNRPRWKRIGLLAAPLLLLIPLQFLGHLWHNIGFAHSEFHIQLKPAAYVVGAYNTLLLMIGVAQLVQKYRRYKSTLWGQQLAAVILGVMVTGVLIVPAGNLLPAMGIYTFLPFSSVFIVAGTLIYAYAITNFKLFSLQTAVDQLRLFPITYKITIAVAAISLLGFFLMQVPVAIWAFDRDDPGWQKFLVFAPIAGLIPSLILILVIVKILSRPLRELTEKTLEVARGNYGAEIELARNDELGVLAKSFNSMSQQMAADIAQLKAIHQALIRTEKLATAGTLATGVAHEVNNPLASISSLVQSLQSRAEDERDRETLRVILTQITRITNVLRSLMDFARPQTPSRTATDINQVLAKSLELARFDKRFKQLDVQVNFSHDLPPLQLDSDQIQQVFLNVLLNARDAIDEAGHKTTGEIIITTRRSADEVVVEIADNGCGIAPENVDRIFDPFFSTKPSSKGTGLGLAVSHSIVAAHGGRITIVSQAQRTSVTIAFPEISS
jgi:signal transduction histidine kinase